MSEWLPDAQRCKANAINALARINDLDPEITGEPRDEFTTYVLVGIAQVWATLATVPDVERIEVRYSDQPAMPDTNRWRSPGGAGQWNG